MWKVSQLTSGPKDGTLIWLKMGISRTGHILTSSGCMFSVFYQKMLFQPIQWCSHANATLFSGPQQSWRDTEHKSSEKSLDSSPNGRRCRSSPPATAMLETHFSNNSGPRILCAPRPGWEDYLLVVWSQYNPATEGVAEVDHAGAAAKTQDFGEGCFHG